MNEKKTLIEAPWRRIFLTFMQRRQNIVLRLNSLTQWGASFRKRLENVYFLACMVQRIEARHLLLCDYRVVSTWPINRRNPLRSHAYPEKDSTFLSLIFCSSLVATMTGSTMAKVHNETTDHFLKGVTANRINHYPIVVFQKGSTFPQYGFKLAKQKHMPVVIQPQEIIDRMQIYTLCTILQRMQDKPGTLRQIPWRKCDSAMTGQDLSLFRWIDKTLLIKHLYRGIVTQENKNFASHKPALLKRERMETQGKADFIQRFPHLMEEGKQMEEAGKVSSALRMSKMIQDNVRSMKPYQRRFLKSADGDKRHVGANSGMVESLTSNCKKFGSNMDLMQWDLEWKQLRGPEDQNSAKTLEISHIMGQERHMERVGRVSSGRRMSKIIQDNVRSMKPYQRRFLKSADGDKRHVGANSGMVESLTSNCKKFGSNMDLMQWDWKRKDFKGSENLSSPELTEIVRQFDQHGLKPFRQKHLPAVAQRKEIIDNTLADILYAIPSRMQDKSKNTEGYFGSISTKIREYPKPAPLNGERIPFYEKTKIQNPIWGKKEIGDRGISIDYHKVADHVYEILTRRIIREKERMGE